MSAYPTHLCTHCLSRIQPKKFTKGSFGMELCLWLLFIVPGLLYSIWRLSSRYEGCPVCKAPNPIPLSSPAARRMLKEDSGSAVMPPPPSFVQTLGTSRAN